MGQPLSLSGDSSYLVDTPSKELTARLNEPQRRHTTSCESAVVRHAHPLCFEVTTVVRVRIDDQRHAFDDRNAESP